MQWDLLGFGHLSRKSTECHTMSVCANFCKVCLSLSLLSIYLIVYLFNADLFVFSGLLIFTYSPREMSRNHWIHLSTSETPNTSRGMGCRKGVVRLPEANNRVKNQSKLTQPGEKPALENTKIFFFSNKLHQSRKVSVH